jgi:hypothetical protein
MMDRQVVFAGNGRWKLGALLVLACWSLVTLWGEYDPGNAIEISALDFDLMLPPGAQETYSLAVKNNDLLEDSVLISVSDWYRTAEGTVQLIEAGKSARSCAPWIKLLTTFLKLKPGQIGDVKFSILVPRTAQAGTYGCTLVVDGSSRATRPGTAVAVRPRVLVTVFVTPPGGRRHEGRLVGLEVRGLNPLGVSLQFQNTGNVHLHEVRGRLEMRNAYGATLETIPVGNFPVLPGAQRRLVVHSSKPRGQGLGPGNYVLLAVLDYGGATLTAGQLHLKIAPLNLRPIGDTQALPRDLDGDGLYEDVDGNGVLELADAVLLGLNIEQRAVQENARAFDFDNDGRVTFADALELKEQVR